MATSVDLLIRAQDIERCELCPGNDRKCEAEVVCHTCHLHLCKKCLSDHVLSNPAIQHNTMKKKSKSSVFIPPNCSRHQNEKYEWLCQECNYPICMKCLASGSHKNHSPTNLVESYNLKQDMIRTDTDELEICIASLYISTLDEIEKMTSRVAKIHREKQNTINEFEKECHKIVGNVINKYRSDAKRSEQEDSNSIHTLKSEVQKQQSLIQSAIEENKSILASNDLSKLFNYTSRNENFRNVSPRSQIMEPQFNPVELTEQIFCHIKEAILTTIKPDNQVDPVSYIESTIGKCISDHDEPRLLKTLPTDYTDVLRVNCIPNSSEFFVFGDDKFITRVNKEGARQKINIKSKSRPFDMTVTSDGHLIYSDRNDKSINRVKNGITRCLIREELWKPLAICSTSTDGLLIAMESLHCKQSKIVRFSNDFKETQQILCSDSEKQLYSFPYSIKESKNLDIVVSDIDANLVVVLDKIGNSKFCYDGNFPSKKFETFHPYGIAIDSMQCILVADSDNHVIHIIDEFGNFLQYIENCDLQRPRGLSIDRKDTLFVIEFHSNKIWDGTLLASSSP